MNILFADGQVECGPASQQDYTGAKFVDVASNQVVYGSCFSQEIPDSAIFPSTMTGVTFRNCNLMNVSIPPGNKTIDCQTQRFAVQTDDKDWEIDANNKPVRPLDWKIYVKRGLPVPTPAGL